jgi:hypothetical protein
MLKKVNKGFTGDNTRLDRSRELGVGLREKRE